MTCYFHDHLKQICTYSEIPRDYQRFIEYTIEFLIKLNVSDTNLIVNNAVSSVISDEFRNQVTLLSFIYIRAV